MSVLLNLGVDWQARGVLVALEPHLSWSSIGETPHVRVRSWALYNGREEHAAITCSVSLGRALLFVFGECRNSDELVVWREELDIVPMNGPTLESLTEEGYRARKRFAPGACFDAAAYIAEMCETWAKRSPAGGAR